jgi:transposase
MVARRRFTREFKISAVQLVNQRRMSIREAADSLGVSVSTLRSWIAKYAGDPLVGGVKSAEDLQSENRRLREENARLRMEREILKKATAFFAREPG